jgi:hypothetical protein
MPDMTTHQKGLRCTDPRCVNSRRRAPAPLPGNSVHAAAHAAGWATWMDDNGNSVPGFEIGTVLCPEHNPVPVDSETKEIPKELR